MSKATIWEYAIIYTPLQTRDQLERGEAPKAVLLVDVQRILAANEAEANMYAARAIPTEYADKMQQCEIAVRPF